MIRVLFIGSNPQGLPGLRFEREIQELQLSTLGSDIDFRFAPDTSVEQLAGLFFTNQPDIIHFSAHGFEGALALSKGEGFDKERCDITAPLLLHSFSPSHPPKLVFLSACSSTAVARELCASGVSAIGVDKDVQIDTARTVARQFYERLLGGAPLKHAFDLARELLSALSKGFNNLHLFNAPTLPVDKPFVVQSRIIAEPFGKDPIKISKQGPRLTVRYGLLNAPEGVDRVVFVTTDRFFEDDDAGDTWGIQSCDGYDRDWNINWSGTWAHTGVSTINVTAYQGTRTLFSQGVVLTNALEVAMNFRHVGITATEMAFEEALRLFAPKDSP